MTLADRIVVMNERVIQQIGPPMEIYSRPANTFVARFVGSPPMTLAPAVLVENGSGEYAAVRLGDGSVVDTRVPRAGLPAGATLELGLRPESVKVAAGGGTSAKVDLVERLGDRTLVYAHLSDGLAITAEDAGTSAVAMGDTVNLRIDGGSAHIFGPDGKGYHAESQAE
jgi:multiple sugar transport system ATP-binding protein